ncbi:hypothetical protein [Hymenobacter arizonensis]|uniref:hypothetical protein n=1 Tax=Hymenobacter arizonensis TaxID=1227077 RepID=UPI001160D11A|nr:hypothetical protein [Hymenobacter arizonensis]
MLPFEALFSIGSAKVRRLFDLTSFSTFYFSKEFLIPFEKSTAVAELGVNLGANSFVHSFSDFSSD